MIFTKKKKDYFYILERHLERGVYNICACGEDATLSKEIKDFEKKIGYCLPDDFVDFSMSSLGGIYVEVKEEFWPRAKAYDVGPFWSFLYGLAVFGFAHDVPEWMDIRKKAEEFKVETESDYIPFMKIMGDADLYCFGEDKKIYQWSHETNAFERIDKNFIDLLEYELSELQQRKDRKKDQLIKPE